MMDSADQTGDAAAKVVAQLRVKDLIERVASASEQNKKDVRLIVEATLAELGKALETGESLNLPPLGKVRIANQRSDDYGGSLENRMRYPLEVFTAMRAAWPKAKPMSVRISANDWIDGGVTPSEAVEVARMFHAAGADIIDVSSGQTDPAEKPIYGRMFQTPFSDRIRHEAGIPTMTVGNISDWDQVNGILMAGRADLVCLARMHLANPYWTLHAAVEQGDTGTEWPAPYKGGADLLTRLREKQEAQIRV